MSERQGPAPTNPESLIYEAYSNCAQQRERVSVAPLVPDEVLDTKMNEVEYHGAIMEYFNRLSPHLPDRPHYWEKIELFSYPMDGAREELAEQLADYYSIDTKTALRVLDLMEHSEKLEEVDDSFSEINSNEGDGTVRGLKSLKHWRNKTYTTTEEREDIIQGREVVEVTEQEYLPREVAMRIHDILDEAASKLGYNTRPGRDITRTEVSEEGFEVTGVESKE